MTLRLDWCSHKAAKAACERWHYSRCVPRSKSVYIGVWERNVFAGAVIFSMGASNHLGSPYGLTPFQTCELTRVALNRHKAPVTRIVSIALIMMRRANPGLRLVVSYADPAQGHHGGVYQGGGWLYSGTTNPDWAVVDSSGKQWHSRICSPTGFKMQFGARKRAMRPQDGTRVILPGKHRYLMPLDDEMRRQIEPLRKPYPKRPKQSIDAPGDQPGEGGEAPTRTLQSSEATLERPV